MSQKHIQESRMEKPSCLIKPEPTFHDQEKMDPTSQRLQPGSPILKISNCKMNLVTHVPKNFLLRHTCTHKHTAILTCDIRQRCVGLLQNGSICLRSVWHGNQVNTSFWVPQLMGAAWRNVLSNPLWRTSSKQQAFLYPNCDVSKPWSFLKLKHKKILFNIINFVIEIIWELS